MVSGKKFEIRLITIVIVAAITILASCVRLRGYGYEKYEQKAHTSITAEEHISEHTSITAEEHISEQYGFHPLWHPLRRSERFPSITDRLKLYLGNWYLPPCNGESLGGIEIINEKFSYRYDYSDSKQYPKVFLTQSPNDNNNKDETMIQTE